MADIEGLIADEVAPKRKVKHPDGWTPHVEIVGNTASAVSEPTANGSADERSLIEGWGLNPDEWRIVGPINVRKWQANLGRKHKGADAEVTWLYYYRANLERVVGDAGDRPDAAALAAWLSKAKPPRRKTALPYGWDIFPVTDSQIGKGNESRGGTRETVARYIDVVGQMQDRILSLGKRRASCLFVPGGGDIAEGCFGQYPSQLWTTDLNDREQKLVARWLLAFVLKELAPYYDRVVTGTVISNHGEKRQNGLGHQTDATDSVDLEVWEAVAEAFAGRKAYDHVEFIRPTDPYVLTMDLDGVGVGITHGHQMSGTVAEEAAWKWWTGHAMGRNPVNEVDLMYVAHRHHHFRRWQQGRFLEGLPAMDGGSQWLTTKTGIWSPPGQYVCSLEPGNPQPQRQDILTPNEDELPTVDLDRLPRMF